MPGPSAAAAAAFSGPGRLPVSRIAARAFAHPTRPGGGNPVTVFLLGGGEGDGKGEVNGGEGNDKGEGEIGGTSLPPQSARAALARTCAWESVFASASSSSSASSSAGKSGRGGGRTRGAPPPSLLAFHLPTGDEVEFCAHAALGAAAVLAGEGRAQRAGMEEAAAAADGAAVVIELVSMADGRRHSATVQPSGEAELRLSASSHEEGPMLDAAITAELREAVGLAPPGGTTGGAAEAEDGSASTASGPAASLPADFNSSVARPKTLVPVQDVRTLHLATDPTDPAAFRTLCDRAGTTGLYLYAPVNTSASAASASASAAAVPPTATFECRQFPRASGYPEDPATGIAAAALAASLRRRGIGGSSARYELLQGTAMGRPSRIGVRFGAEEGDGSCMYVSGLVEVLSREEERMEVGHMAPRKGRQ